jgi:hypothetical protein
MRTYQGVTSQEYADRLVNLAKPDLLDNVRGMRASASWGDLHDHIDANDYLTDADQSFYLLDPIRYDDHDYIEFVNEAISLAEPRLFAPEHTTTEEEDRP